MSRKYRYAELVENEDNLIVDAYNTEEAVVVDEPVVIELEAPVVTKTESCKVECFISGKVMTYFKGFGLQFETKNKYKRNDFITIAYTSDIGSPDFKAWIVE